ncbi:MAG: two-component system OmpR family sensor kinase [Elusimicrobia bacterium]|nr:MAG: two-component system OmpR family sensor kinase [Elusimicrobiota bacterium]KAF0158143.1 MAG: two-component system OmpR family sensor kinase [Elusimicrobiota bacterium]
MTLFNRLLLIIFGIGLIPIIPTGGFLFYYQSVAKENVLTLHQSLSGMAGVAAAAHLEALVKEVSWLASSAGKDEKKLVSSALGRQGRFALAAVLDGQGRELHKDGTFQAKRLFGELDFSGSHLFSSAASSGKPVFGNFELVYDLPVCHLFYPLEGGRWFFAAVDLREIFALLGRQRIGSAGGVYLADSSGGLFGSPSGVPPVDPDALKDLFSGEARYSAGIAARGAAYIGAFSPVPGFDLMAVTLQARHDAFRGINLITSLIVFFLLAISTVFYFSALLLSRRLIGPVGELMAGAARVTGQNFKEPVSEDTGIREFAELLKAFNAMMREVDRYQEMQVEKVLEEKQKTDLLISLLHDAMILCDLRGELVYANARARSLLGLGPAGGSDEANRLKISDIVKLRATKGEVISLANPAGEALWFRVNIQVLSPRKQKPAMFILLRDVTAERQLQAMKDDFFHSVAHDLRAPLLSMQGHIRLLEKSLSGDAEKAGRLTEIKSSSARIFELLENILDISRMESGSVRLEKETFPAAALAGTASARFRHLFEERGVALEVSVPEDLSISGDRKMLERLLENLLSNALKFTPGGGKVSVSAAPAEGGAEFVVADTGPGIPEGELESVFDKYSRAKGSDKPGFGLGLAIVKRIVALHGGTIRAEAGKGGVFRVFLPRAL